MTVFLVAKLLYKSKYPSVCQPRLGRNVIFSAPSLDRCLISSSFATYGCCHPCCSNQTVIMMNWKEFYQHYISTYGKDKAANRYMWVWQVQMPVIRISLHLISIMRQLALHSIKKTSSWSFLCRKGVIFLHI